MGYNGMTNGYTRPGKRTNDDKWKDPPFSMGKSTNQITIFNGYVSLAEGNWFDVHRFEKGMAAIKKLGLN